MPEHGTYLEYYFGLGAVLLNKEHAQGVWVKETKLGKPVAGEQRLEVLWLNPVATEFGSK